MTARTSDPTVPTDTYTEECNRCNGTGIRHDATLADKVNQGANPHQCNHCRGTGCRTLVKLYPALTPAGAIPEWDPTAGTPEWMLG